MEIAEGKEKFLQAWGTMGSSWGISRTMASIHALLLISKDPICAETVMEELQISRGNANMNLRALIDWGLVKKEFKPGERKEFFTAVKDIWEVARCIMAQRKRRELEPMLDVLAQVSQVKADKDDAEAQEFKRAIADISKFAEHSDKIFERMIKSDSNWFFQSLLKLLK
ncbi:MAG: transcriptional regulator [Bacteroidia bacterium]|nr:transcriptional regulator [Bacteroidia bacterium]